MKNNFVKILVGLLVVVFVGVGCSKSDFDINKNPNSPTDSTITYNLLLPGSLQTSATNVATNWGFLQNWLSFWARSGTYAPNVTEETYNITTTFQNGVWNSLYYEAFNYNIMELKAKQAGATFYEGVARIMKAHAFQNLVDVYNNVPYFNALKGNQNPTPEYDKGLDIYKDLFRQIDTAFTLFDELNPDLNIDYETNDLLYGGDVTLWKKFGNTLKLRMLVHLAEVSDFDFEGEIAIIDATGVGYLGSGESADIDPGFNSTKPAPFYNTYVRDNTGTATANSVYFKANSYAIGYYQYNGDPRLTRFYAAGSQGNRGVQYGLPPVTSNAAGTLSSVSGPGVAKESGYNSDAWIITSMESFFLQAEARERGIIQSGETAEELLRKAIQESFIWMGLTSEAADTYVTNNASFPDVDYTAVGGGLFTIISQKWFALNTFATLEVWSDYRRNDIDGKNHFVYGERSEYDPGPAISVAPQNTATEIPIRLLYPQNEYNYNAKNVGAEGNINQFSSKIFWDLN